MDARLDRVLPDLSAAPRTILSASLDELHQTSRYELSLIQWRHEVRVSCVCAECGHRRLNAEQAMACCTMQGSPCPLCDADDGAAGGAK